MAQEIATPPPPPPFPSQACLGRNAKTIFFFMAKLIFEPILCVVTYLYVRRTPMYSNNLLFYLARLIHYEGLALREDQNPLEGLLKCRLASPLSRVSDSMGLGCGLRICISNKSQVTLICSSGDHALGATDSIRMSSLRVRTGTKIKVASPGKTAP